MVSFLARHERVIDYGLNWKSLTQPAILPLNTDYLPSVKDLDRYYTVSQYTVTFVKEDSPFNTLQSALKELVAQRLSRVSTGLYPCDPMKLLTSSLSFFAGISIGGRIR